MDNLTSNSGTETWSGYVLPLGAGRTPDEVLKVLRQREPDEGSLREQLATCVNDIIREKALTQTALSAMFGIPQPHISELKHHKLSRFSSERLLRFLTLLEQNVDIVVRPKADGSAVGVVSVNRAT